MGRGVDIQSRILAAALLGWFSTLAYAQSGRVTVIYTSEAEPYTEALAGLRAMLGSIPQEIVDLHSPNAQTQLRSLLEQDSNRLIITIGGDALEAISARNLDMPVVASMIMRSEQAKRRVSAAVRLDIPVADILAELKKMFPDKTRIAIIRNPAYPGQIDSAAVTRARQQGVTIRVVDAGNPEELVRLIHSLRGQVDFVVCLPDSALYNGTTVKPLILASLESRLLVVGFSQSFVRAGAAIGIYPDFRDIGAQTGEVAQRQLAHPGAAADEGPRKVVVAINQRVIRLLGLEYQARRDGEVVVVR